MSLLATTLVFAAVAGAPSSDVVEMGATVTGNQEQPHVLYIVPWKNADGPASLYQDFSSRIDNLLDPVAREAFQRELGLRQRFEQQAQAVGEKK